MWLLIHAWVKELISIITWCRQYQSLSNNILLIKCKLKLESRAIVVGVAMSPRNLGGKYRCRHHPWWRKCTRQFFFARSRACQSNCIRVASSLGDSIVVDHVVCLKVEFLWHTVLSNAIGAFYTYDIYINIYIYIYVCVCVCVCVYIRTWTARYVFYWDRLLDECLAFVKAGVPSCSGDVMHRSYANFKWEVADVNNGIPIDFRAIKCVSVESGQPCRDSISWYIQFN